MIKLMEQQRKQTQELQEGRNITSSEATFGFHQLKMLIMSWCLQSQKDVMQVETQESRTASIFNLLKGCSTADPL